MTVVVDIQGNSKPIESSISALAKRFRGLEQVAAKTGSTASFVAKPVVNTASAIKELQLLNKTAAGVAASIDGVKNSLVAAFAVGSAALGIAVLNTQLNSLLDISTNLNNSLKQVTESSEDLYRIQAKLQGLARNSGGTLEATTGLYSKLSKALAGTGKSEDDILRFSETLTKAAASSGSSAETIAASMYQLQQGISSGVLRGEELNSVYEGIRPVAKIFEDFLGVTSGELRELAADGQLTTDVIVKALESGFYDVEENFLKTSRTIASAKQVAIDAVTVKAGEIDQLFGISQRKIATYLKIADLVNSIVVSKNIPNLADLNKKGAGGGAQQTQQTQQQLTVLERLNNALQNLSVTAEYTGVVLVGTFKVLGAVFSRLADYLPDVELASRTLGSRLVRGAKTAIASSAQSILRTYRETFLNIFQFTGYGLQEAVNDLFTADTPDELAQAFEDLAARISSYGKNWFNVYRNISTYFLGIQYSIQDTLRGLGLLDQQLLIIRKRTTDSFKTIAIAAREIFVGFSKDLLNTKLIIDIYNFIGVTLDRISLITGIISRDLSNLFNGVASAASNKISALIAPFEKLGASISKAINFKDSNSEFLQDMTALFNSLYSVAVAGLTKISNIFSRFFSFIKAGFLDMYIDVVGNSTWPDLLDGLVAYTDRVLPVIVGKFNDFYSKIKSVFKEIDFGEIKVNFDGGIDFAGLKDSIGLVVEQLITSIRANFPLVASYISAAIAAGLAVLFDPALYSKVSAFLKLSLAGAAGEFVLDLLGGLGTLEQIAEDIGTVLGNSAGSFVALIARNAPTIVDSLVGLAVAFGNAFLDQLGIIGSAIKTLSTVTGTNGLLSTLIFGAGVPLLLGNFKQILTVLNVMLTAFSGKSFGGIGQKKGKQDGLLGSLLLGDGRTVIAGILAVYAALDLIPNLLSGDFNSIITQGGLLALLILGPSGTLALLKSTITFVLAQLASLGVTTSLLKSGGGVFGGLIDSAKKAAPLIKSIFTDINNLRKVGQKDKDGKLVINKTLGNIIGSIKEKLVSLGGILSTALGTAFSGVFSGLGGRLNAYLAPLFASAIGLLKGFAARATQIAVSAGGLLGAVGKTLFGKLGIGALIAAITAIFASAASAGEAGGSVLGGLGIYDYGLIGLMLFGPLGASAIKAVAAKLVGTLFRDTLAAASVSAVLEGTLVTTVGAAVRAALARLAVGVVAFIAGIPGIVAAAVAAVVAGLGYLVYKAYDWFTTTKAEQEARKRIQELKALAEKTNEELNAVFEKDNVESIFKEAKIKLDINAFLDTTILEGSSEEVIKDVAENTKNLSDAIDSANEVLKSEGQLTRSAILNVRDAVKDLERATEGANLDNYRKQADTLRTSIIDSLKLRNEVPQQAITNAEAGFTGNLLSLDPTAYTKETRVLLGLLKDIETQLPLSTADPASAVEYFRTVEELANKINIRASANGGLLGYLFPQDLTAIDGEIEGLTIKLDVLRENARKGITIELRGEAFERRLKKIADEAEALQLSGLKVDDLINQPEEVLVGLEAAIEKFKSKYGVGLDKVLDTEGLDRQIQAPTLEFAVDRQGLITEVNTALNLVQEEVKKRGISPLDTFNSGLKDAGLDIQVDYLPSQKSFEEANRLIETIKSKMKELANLTPANSFKGPEILREIDAAQRALFNNLATTEQQLESIGDLIGGIPDINAALALSPELIARVQAYAAEIRALLALLASGSLAALPSPDFRQSPTEAAQSRVKDLQLQAQRILGGAPPPGASSGYKPPKVKGGGGGGGGGGGEAAKTWWEEFQDGLKSLDLTIDSDILAGLQLGTIDKLTAMSGKYKAAQEALNNSTKNEVELRRKSLELMQQARQEAIQALNDGTVGGATAALESAGVKFDEGMIGRLNAASVAYATQLALRIDQLTLERNTMALGSAAAVQATNAISAMKLELESMTSSSQIMRDAFNSGLQSFLKGQSTFKDFVDGLLDTFTNTIIEKFSTSFTDSLFNSLGLDNLFGKLFGGASKLGSGLGGGLGGALQPGSTPANPLWTKSTDGLLGGALGGGGGGGGGGGLFGWLFGLLGFAEGGKVSGPGTSTSDSIVARLSAGEYVVNAKSTKQWLPLLEQINSNGKMPAFATGGKVGPASSKVFKAVTGTGASKSQQTFNINVTGDVSSQTRKEVLAMLPEISAGVGMVNRERGSR